MASPWGTMGLQPIVRPGDDGGPIEDVGRFFDPNRQPVSINGKEYYRVGEDLNQTWQGWDPAAQAYLKGLSPEQRGFMDPTYGGVTPADTYSQLAEIMGPINAGGSLDPLAKAAFGAMAGAGLGFAMGPGFAGFEAMGTAIPGMAPGTTLLQSLGITNPLSGVSDAWGVNPRDGADIYGDIYREFAGGGTGATGTAASTFGDIYREFNPPDVYGNLYREFAGGAGASTSALGKLLSGGAGIDDYLKIGGALGSGLLGYLGSEAQADSLSGISDKYLALGQPYRAKLAQSYEPGFDLAKQDPAYQGALDQSSQSVLRKLSATGGGNPFDQPASMANALDYVAKGTALPQLNTYRSQLGGFGQLGINTAGTADLSGAQNAGSGYDALGYGLGSLTNPQPDLAQLLKQLGGMKLTSGFSL